MKLKGGVGYLISYQLHVESPYLRCKPTMAGMQTQGLTIVSPELSHWALPLRYPAISSIIMHW